MTPSVATDWEGREGDYLAQGAIGGIGSMDRHGKGFQHGFWSAESSALTSDANISTWLKKTLAASDTWEQKVISIAEKGIASGVVSHIGGKSFDNSVRDSLRAGSATEILNWGISTMVTYFDWDIKLGSANGGASAGYKLLQPKVGKSRVVTYPINSVTGGSWSLGGPWAAL